MASRTRSACSLLRDLAARPWFCFETDRLGPDLLFTHWLLHFPTSMRWLCNHKFRRFGSSAEFRPGAYAFFTGHIEIGERVVIRPGTVIAADSDGDIVIEDDVLIGMGVHIYADNHRFDDVRRPIIEQGYEAFDVRLCTGCWIGANATLLPGVTIGRNAVVAAGAVVTDDVESFCVVGGVPARVIKRLKISSDDGV